jgi:hypothetical protein
MDHEHAGAATAVGPRVHDIGAGGVVSIAVGADDVRIQGVDGTEVRVVAPADGVGIVTDAQPGRFDVRTLHHAGHAGAERSGFVGLKIGGRGFGFPFGFRASGTIELEVPRDARVEVSSTAGDVALRDIHGDAQVRTLSGDVSIKQAAGRLTVGVTSGDVTVTGAEPVSLDVHAVSGNVRARAPRFDRVAIETISGDAELAGTFGAGVDHRISTVSGDVEVAVIGGLAIEVKTISGDVRCDHPERREGDGRKRRLVIGDGAARLAVRSMSGDVEVRAGRAAPGAALPASDLPAAFGFPETPTPPAPPLPPTEIVGEANATTLAVLEALARGEIDVAEAERRLGGAPTAAEVMPDA